LSNNSTTWLDSLLDQDAYGTGWEIGAFVYGGVSNQSVYGITIQ
jgi:hypothetical protein